MNEYIIARSDLISTAAQPARLSLVLKIRVFHYLM